MIGFQNTDAPTTRSVHLEINIYHRVLVETLGRPEFVGQCQSCLLVPDSPCCWFGRDSRALKKQNEISKTRKCEKGLGQAHTHTHRHQQILALLYVRAYSLCFDINPQDIDSTSHKKEPEDELRRCWKILR